MRTIDLSPLYRSVVGFDRLADLLDSASTEAATGYPPYNIERTDENAYRIEIAVEIVSCLVDHAVHDEARAQDHQRVAVGGAYGRELSGDAPTRAGAVVHHHVLPQGLGEWSRNGACDQIQPAARS